MSLILRSEKSSPITWREMDDNLIYLEKKCGYIEEHIITVTESDLNLSENIVLIPNPDRNFVRVIDSIIVTKKGHLDQNTLINLDGFLIARDYGLISDDFDASIMSGSYMLKLNVINKSIITSSDYGGKNSLLDTNDIMLTVFKSDVVNYGTIDLMFVINSHLIPFTGIIQES